MAPTTGQLDFWSLVFREPNIQRSQGPIDYNITTDPTNDVVFLAFSKPTKWVGMTPDEAENLAGQLQEAKNSLG